MSDNVKTSNFNSILIGIVMLMVSGMGTMLYSKMEKQEETSRQVAVVSSKLDEIKDSQAVMRSEVMPRTETELKITSIRKDLEIIRSDNNDFRLQILKLQVDIDKIKNNTSK